MIPGMFAAGAARGGGSEGGDPHWSNVIALLHFDGGNDSTDFHDETGRAWVASGDARISTLQSRFGGASGVFDRPNSFIRTSDGTAMSLGGAITDVTIEAWIRPRAIGQLLTIAGKRPPSPEGEWVWFVHTDGSLEANAYTSASFNVFDGSRTASGVISANQWSHVALTRAGGVVRQFVNGLLLSEMTQVTQAWAVNADTFIGRVNRQAGSRDFDGWIDEFRFTSGVARYTSNFTPPSAPFPNGP